jgi:hypothetical protein
MIIKAIVMRIFVDRFHTARGLSIYSLRIFVGRLFSISLFLLLPVSMGV